jgi:hypothetical protein
MYHISEVDLETRLLSYLAEHPWSEAGTLRDVMGATGSRFFAAVRKLQLDGKLRVGCRRGPGDLRLRRVYGLVGQELGPGVMAQ